MTPQDQHDHDVKQTKSFRRELNLFLSTLRDGGSQESPIRESRSRDIAAQKVEEAIMWLGKDLQEMNVATPYPESMNSGNTIIEHTADSPSVSTPEIARLTAEEVAVVLLAALSFIECCEASTACTSASVLVGDLHSAITDDGSEKQHYAIDRIRKAIASLAAG